MSQDNNTSSTPNNTDDNKQVPPTTNSVDANNNTNIKSDVKVENTPSPRASSSSSTPVNSFLTTLILNQLKHVDVTKLKDAVKSNGAQTLISLVSEITSNEKFRTPSKLTVQDIQDLVSRHGADALSQLAKEIIDKKILSTAIQIPPSLVKDKTPPGLDVSSLKIDENTNFSAFVTYVLNAKEYKDKYADAQIISFIAANNIEKDIVLGNANKWLDVINHARLLASTASIDKKAAVRISGVFVENSLGKELGAKFKEHFSPKEIKEVKEPVGAKVKAKP